MTVELPLVVLGGLLGSGHCVGMCGGFALTIGMGARSAGENIARQLIFGSGRVFTYGFLGAVAGFAGSWFARRAGSLVHLQAGLSILAGGLLAVQGLRALGITPRMGRAKTRPAGGSAPCLVGTFAAPFLKSPRRLDVFLAGVLNGLLPCGLVYAYLSLASSAATLVDGLATMVAFGLGTVPMMALTGAGASALSYAARRRLLRVAAVCVLVTGVLAIARGAMFLGTSATEAPRCPACAGDV